LRLNVRPLSTVSSAEQFVDGSDVEVEHSRRLHLPSGNGLGYAEPDRRFINGPSRGSFSKPRLYPSGDESRGTVS